ncbi:MAG: hypothetical protein C4525_08825 [Desulfarculus sp.]|jgi:hypothetical protein|nr:MAG: hypothetical protein C4525_08825 [Desulfarculus sp.]
MRARGTQKTPDAGSRGLCGRAWLAWAAALLILAGCAQYGTLDPGPNPAKVRVLLNLNEDRSRFDQFDDVLPYTRWDWGLYIVQDGKMTALRTAGGQSLKAILGYRLVQDVVFLVPPGQWRLRLLVEGYVGLREGRYYRPVDVAYVQQDFEVNLAPGQEITLRPSAGPRG